MVLTRGTQRKENSQPNGSKAAALSWPDEVELSGSLESALELLAEQRWRDRVEHVFVIGGGKVRKSSTFWSGKLCMPITARTATTFDDQKVLRSIYGTGTETQRHLIRHSSVWQRDLFFAHG